MFLVLTNWRHRSVSNRSGHYQGDDPQHVKQQHSKAGRREKLEFDRPSASLKTLENKSQQYAPWSVTKADLAIDPLAIRRRVKFNYLET
jgi:hypothetical protein